MSGVRPRRLKWAYVTWDAYHVTWAPRQRGWDGRARRLRSWRGEPPGTAVAKRKRTPDWGRFQRKDNCNGTNRDGCLSGDDGGLRSAVRSRWRHGHGRSERAAGSSVADRRRLLIRA